MASCPITSWQIEGEKVEAVTDYFLRLQNHCRRMRAAAMKLKKMLAPGKKSYDKPRQCIKKQIHHTTDKGQNSQSYGFCSSLRCESSTIKIAEHPRIDAFELSGWKRLLRVPWTARRSNQSILKAISPGCSLEGMMLKLKLQYFGHLMQRTDSLEKTLMLGKIEGGRRRGRQR